MALERRNGHMFIVGRDIDHGPIATEEQIARFQRHLKAGTSPGNPPWYKFPTVKEFKFKPRAKPVFAKGLDELRIEDED